MPRKGGKRKDPGPVPPARLVVDVDEEIDLHGLTIAEAMAQVEMALARWSRAGGRLRCIHGHSSGSADSIKGALRRNLGSIWKGKIDSFRPEPGNPGATLVRVGNP
jgi:DNA-nicking Smr family endonuclease